MPPQIGSRGARDVLPSPRTRRSLVRRPHAEAEAQPSEKTKCSPAPALTMSQRSSRSKSSMTTAVAGAGAVAAVAPGTPPDASWTLKGDGDLQVQSRVAAMQAKYGQHLNFLVTEFTDLEANLAPKVGACSVSGDEPRQQLSRLRYFIAHVQNTINRMEQARVGLHRYTMAQLDMLEEHIAERLLPVKERMIQQLGTPSRRTNPCAGASEGRNGQINVGCELSLSGEMAGDGTGAVSAESAVSDAWIEASKTAGVDSGLAPPTSSMASSLTKPCSALSLVELDLCGDADEDDCPGAFLVDSCDDDGSGIGLDLYDLDQPLPAERSPERCSSMSSTSSASGVTDGEFSDDALSIDANRAGLEDTKSTIRRDGIEKEMGALSELFVPEAFSLTSTLDSTSSTNNVVAPAAKIASTTVDTENGNSHGSVSSTEPATARIDMKPDPSVDPVPSNEVMSAMTSVPNGPPVQMIAVDPKPSLSAPSSSGLQASAAIHVLAGSSQVMLNAPPPTVAVASTGGATWSTASVPEQVRRDCRCGEASCAPQASSIGNPAVMGTALKRPLESSLGLGGIGSSGPGGNAPAPLATGMSLSHAMITRPRKRQRSLAPVLSAPRMISYECSLCKETYQAEISSNPWWSLFRQECPRCQRMQIPRVDSASAATSVDYIHAICAEEGEGWESDGYGSDSCSESDDEDDEYREGIAYFDTEEVAGDGPSPSGSTGGRLTTAQASRLLVLMSHARTCPGRHAKAQHAEVCRSTKFLMLHIRDCTGRNHRGEPCEHRWCRPCKSLLGHLIRCPEPHTCRICTPVDLPEPLRQLRELNLAQARAVAAASSPDPRCVAMVKTEGRCLKLPTQAATHHSNFP